jgi:hypothetical protein
LLFLSPRRKRSICGDTPLTCRTEDRLGLVGSRFQTLQQGELFGYLLVVRCTLKQRVKFTDASGDLT